MELLSWLQPQVLAWLNSPNSAWQISSALACVMILFACLAAVLQRASNRLPPDARPMPSALSWLVLIPVFGLFWSWAFSQSLIHSWVEQPEFEFSRVRNWVQSAHARLVGQIVCLCLPVSLIALPLLHGFSLLMLGVPLLFLTVFSVLFFVFFWVGHLCAIWHIGRVREKQSTQPSEG